MLILSLSLFKLSFSTRSKIFKMKKVNPNEAKEEQTYCYLSVVIVNLVMILDIVAIVYVMLIIYMFALGDTFSS